MDEVRAEREGCSQEVPEWLPALMEKDRLSHTSRLIRGLIHNINGSLHNLSMLSEMLQQGQTKLDSLLDEHNIQTNAEFAMLRTKQSERLQRLMQQIAVVSEMLQDFSIIHEMLGGTADVDIAFVLQKLARIFRSDLFFKHRVDVKLRLQEDLPSVHVPGRALVPALMHLIRNALLALSVAEDRRLCIECSTAGGHVRIAIRDTGIGFNPSQKEELTGIFFSDWSTEIREKDDLESHFGLGLYSVRSLLAPYGVRLSLGREGNETVALLEIPLLEQA